VVSAAGWLKQDFPEIKAARLLTTTSSVRRGDVEYSDPVAWVDPDFFKVLPLPALAGDPDTVMHRPDGLVLTQTAARKYFGQERPIGQTLQISRALALPVGAVVKDPPANTHLKYGIFASGQHPLSGLRRQEAFDATVPRGRYDASVTVYVQLADAAAAARINAGMKDFVKRHLALADGKLLGGTGIKLELLPLRDLHLAQFRGPAQSVDTQGNSRVLTALAVIALLILVMACINFVNLMTARASQRMVEVGVRKLAGAERRHLVLQFVGEALIYAFLGLLVATAAVELLLPRVRAALDRPMPFDYWRDPALTGAALVATVLVGVLAGVYPAFVQSSFRPAVVLKGGLLAPPGGLAVREGLVISQFAVLIGLMVSAAVIAAQTHFAMNEGLKLQKDAVLMLDVSQPPDFTKSISAPRRLLCREPFFDQIKSLPGVRGAACANAGAMDASLTLTSGKGPSGEEVGMILAPIDYGFFELYGVKPVAGRFFSQPGDAVPQTVPPQDPRVVIVNETSARLLGFPSAGAAVGQIVKIGFGRGEMPSVQIVGVAPDVEINALRKETRARIYLLLPQGLNFMHVKLGGGRIAETVKAIDAAWRATGMPRPPRHRFVDQYLQTVYAHVIVQGLALVVLCAIALVIGCLGLFGLTAFTAERRTKEIGIRKTMGAGERDIVTLMLWSFTRPVLWANLIAWPLGWWAMSRWLQGFSSRIALSPLFFVGAGGAALVIAAITVSAHAFAIARAKPVGALRYE
jgi:putative ABC transport system permease protein